MKRSGLRPTKKHALCNGTGCSICDQRGWMPKPSKAKPRIKPLKDGRSALNHQYSLARRAFLLAHPRCEVLGPGSVPCGKPASDLHHRKLRGRYYLDETTWMATCQSCHTWIHENPAISKKLGYLINPASTCPIKPIAAIEALKEIWKQILDSPQ